MGGGGALVARRGTEPLKRPRWFEVLKTRHRRIYIYFLRAVHRLVSSSSLSFVSYISFVTVLSKIFKHGVANPATNAAETMGTFKSQEHASVGIYAECQ